MSLWYDNGSGGQRQGVLAPGADSTTNSYPGHKFCFADVGLLAGGCEAGAALGRTTVCDGPAGAPQEYTYLFEDGTANAAHAAAWAAESSFDEAYLARTGRRWVAYWPKPPPTLPLWEAAAVGQTHEVSTAFGPFDCPLPEFWTKDWRRAAADHGIEIDKPTGGGTTPRDTGGGEHVVRAPGRCALVARAGAVCVAL